MWFTEYLFVYIKNWSWQEVQDSAAAVQSSPLVVKVGQFGLEFVLILNGLINEIFDIANFSAVGPIKDFSIWSYSSIVSSGQPWKATWTPHTMYPMWSSPLPITTLILSSGECRHICSIATGLKNKFKNLFLQPCNAAASDAFPSRITSSFIHPCQKLKHFRVPNFTGTNDWIA